MRFIALLLAPLVVLVIMIGAPATSMAAELPVNLGTASTYTLLAGSTITSTGPTAINGDVGVHPGTVFTPGEPPAVVNGEIHLGDAVAAQAKADLVTAYNDAAGRTPVVTVPTELGGTTRIPGVYDSAAGDFQITGTLTIDAQGDPDAVFIFKTASTLITAVNSNVHLINGAQASRVYWQVGSSATLGVNSHFEGIILAMASITANTGSTVKGQLLARDGAVTVDSVTGTNPLLQANYGVSVAPVTYAKFGKPMTAVTYNLTVTNTGNVSDTFNATKAGMAWPTSVPAIVGPLAAGASSNVTVTATIPAGTPDGTTDTVLVTFTSAGDPTKSATSTLTTTANENLLAFYFAEGTTRANFQEYLCLGNSGAVPASAQVTYMFTDGSTQDANYSVPANSRSTMDVNSVVGAEKDLSISILTTSPNLIAERPMYFNYNGQWTGGSDALGAVAPDMNWYFAEGNTLPEFDQYVTVLNPGNDAADLTFHYMVEGQGEEAVPGTVGAHSRATFRTKDQIGNGKHVSLYLESTQGVVAERPMYFNYLGLAQNNWTGGHDVVGANAPNTDWYFAEGTTRKNAVDGAFEEWLCMQNPGITPLTVEATYQLAVGQGNPINKSYTVPAQERLTVSVNQEIGQDKDCSVFLQSTSDFIAERPMYFSYHAFAWTGGHDVLGTNGSATDWFFAEGTTRANFEEWLCLQNPGNTDALTTITYFPAGGPVITKQWTVKANTRLTVSASSDVGADQDISALVSSDQPIIVERPMYFDFNGWTGGHDVVGFVPTP
ncbi:MAG: DUF3494 domain-containing protein [Actinobacteria bacterium]|nr:DUF3494 domain-containing protein [Actinomycetota bacterium]MBU1944266.1 DUF3494 domain-containing protein [Actinomycetota bacterium]MBU2688819.1 DUF3494 domain-containing protein [Actinomycetota bacterium]